MALLLTRATGPAYTDEQVRDAVAALFKNSSTLSFLFDDDSDSASASVKLASLDPSYFSNLAISTSTFSAADQAKLENPDNWSGVQWIGAGSQELTGTKKFDLHLGATYLYINAAPNYPVRLARA